MSKPVRLQLSRAQGFDLQALSQAANGLRAVVVSRPSRWGNPWRIDGETTREAAIIRFRKALLGNRLDFSVKKVRLDLAGKNLACWCALGLPCHADILLDVANGGLGAD
jgi:hypothetical protein